MFGQGCPKCHIDYSDPEYKHFTYKITNTINNKIYIGIHSTKNVNDGYMGSGSLLKEAQYQQGIKSFQKEILSFYKSRDDLRNAERIIVNQEFINRSDTYNVQLGG